MDNNQNLTNVYRGNTAMVQASVITSQGYREGVFVKTGGYSYVLADQGSKENYGAFSIQSAVNSCTSGCTRYKGKETEGVL
jgi:hypothetical protein